MPDYDIILRSPNVAADLDLPDGMQLLSYDNGIVNVQLDCNGMRFVVMPFGKGGSAMMRRLCVGGSRLEDRTGAGACHVIEHAKSALTAWVFVGLALCTRS